MVTVAWLAASSEPRPHRTVPKVLEQLPWDAASAWDDATVPEAASLLTRTGLLRGMRPRQRAHARRLEMASHLSALAHGEQCAVGLGAQTVLLCPEDAPEQRWFLGTLIADEAKHHLALEQVTLVADYDRHFTYHGPSFRNLFLHQYSTRQTEKTLF